MLSLTDTQLFEWITVLVMPLFRILGLMTSAPVLSNRAMSGRLRLTIGLSVSLLVSMVIEVPSGVSLAAPGAWLLVARELGIGLLIGFVARLIFAAFELAGEIIGLQMGLSFAGFFDPSAGHANALGRLLNNFAMLTFVVLNGPLVLLVAVVQSFEVFPIATTIFEPRTTMRKDRYDNRVGNLATIGVVSKLPGVSGFNGQSSTTTMQGAYQAQVSFVGGGLQMGLLGPDSQVTQRLGANGPDGGISQAARIAGNGQMAQNSLSMQVQVAPMSQALQQQLGVQQALSSLLALRR